ncbi:gluconokinase [Nocardia amamiensis]|uniref:Gluconokinase n=1 Tax=Nocardia amamiensis TaxID=404578 RepID=A0ABS0CSJ3_9NOCA|nr:gluconokinase [Nocardia amamiensis]MBF6298818.1 gluconokinase [Nocardia amamiensis]
MGVSGSGKTTVGTRLADALGVAYTEGDDFHPPANIAKMAAGTPLDDADRAPWLDALAAAMAERSDRGAVVACSALKRVYRDRLRATVPEAFFLHLDVPRVELERRITNRREHFLPPSLLDSQLATLEPLDADEKGVTVDATRTPEELVREVVAMLGR